MYNGTRVFDVHGHVTAPPAVRGWATLLLSSNTVRRSPLSMRNPPSNLGDLSDEAFQRAAKSHVDYIDARNIDMQIIGPRPFVMMGWMQPHLLPAWVAFQNDCIK